MTDWISLRKVSEMTGLPVDHLKELRYEKRVFPFYKPTQRTVLYDRSEVEQVIAATRRNVRPGP